MIYHNEIKAALLSALLLVLLCGTAGRARAELVEETADGITEYKTATADHYMEEDTLPIVTATPGSYMPEKTERALMALSSGYAVVNQTGQMLLDESDDSKEKNNLNCTRLEASAELTGPNEVKIHLAVTAAKKRFYGFQIGRSDEMDEQNVFMVDPDVDIRLPDESSSTPPFVENTRFGTVSIDKTGITTNRYRPRDLEITWVISRREELERFHSDLPEDTLWLNLGGYFFLIDGGRDVLAHNGAVGVPGLSEAVRMGSCAHEEKECRPLNEHTHSVCCRTCGYVYPEEPHHIEKGRCKECGFEVIVNGEAEHILNGRTVTENYEGVEENPYIPASFPGYFPPEPVMIPKGGGKITVIHDPVHYTVVTEDSEETVCYDESLFLAGGRRKGFTLESYEVVDVTM